MFHHEERHTAPRLADIVNADDAGMGTTRHGAGLPFETGDGLSFASVARHQRLDRDLPSQARLIGQIHTAASSLAKHLLQDDISAQSLLDVLGQPIAHRGAVVCRLALVSSRHRFCEPFHTMRSIYPGRPHRDNTRRRGSFAPGGRD